MNARVETLYRQALAAAQSGNDRARALKLANALCDVEPEHFDHQQIAGIAALEVEDADAALAHFRIAVRLANAPHFAAAAWGGLGRAELLRDNPTGAEAAFRRSLSLVYDYAPALVGIAEALERQRRFAEAETAGHRALERGHDEPRLRLVLGHACIGQDKLDAAETEFKAAIAQQPEAQEPRFGLGLIAKIRGDLDGAMSQFRAVLDEVPEYPGYAQFAFLNHFSAGDGDLRLLERCYARLRADAPAAARSDLLFALAKAYDDTGETDKASERLREANRLEATRVDHDPAPWEAFAQRLETLFTRKFITRFPGAGLAELSPIFIVSMPRSGSTLMEQMLAAHSQIRGGGEIGRFYPIALELGRKWGARPEFPELDAAVAEPDLRTAGREYAKQTAALRLLKPRFTDKTLNNYFYIGLIHMMLPDARIVHMRRHPLATALGIYRQRFTAAVNYSFDLDHIVRHYRAYARLMEHWRKAIPEAFIELFYEQLVAEPEQELHRALDYLGLDFEPACLEFDKLDRPVHTASVIQVREPLNTRGLARHERYRELLAPVAEALREEIADYERELADAQNAAAGSPASTTAFAKT
ncbi:MAG: sulfotransferase [Gammaproteobacteria bacterium]